MNFFSSFNKLKSNIMKCLNRILAIVLILLYYSCDNVIVDENIADNVKDASTRASYYCSDHYCIPKVGISRSGGTVYVDWESVSGNDHSILLSCSSSFFSYSNTINPTGGEWMFSVPDNEPCIVSYSVHCAEYACRDCNASGSAKLYWDGRVIKGTSTECFKDYVYYHIDGISGNTIKIILSINTSNEMLKNADKYMEIDAARAYNITKGEKPCAVLFNKKWASDIEVSLPFVPDSNFRVELFSTKCAYNKEHYLEVLCSTNSFNFYLSSININERKAHSK